ncbi:exocyst complex component 3-like [Watersipora subatra]|uniref:exocyst complex component 3-like n=1 Tax=Watersipora subatra TaxID=2589382 RepID=UPI00355C7350
MNQRKGDADEMARLERDTIENSRKQVAGLLQRPDQLERVEQLKKRYIRKKAAADAHLKNAVQSQLDGVKTGLNQLRSCLVDINVVRNNLEDIHTTYYSVSGLKDKLLNLSQESTKHYQLSSAVGSLKHIANVPEHVTSTMKVIEEGRLLEAHRQLADLEGSRDQLLLEVHRQMQKSEYDPKYENDAKMLQGYFAKVHTLSEQLGKQLWLILGRALASVRKEPTVVVAALRIIERECRLDDQWKQRYEDYGFMPADRPKKWREKAINVLHDSVANRLEGCQLEERDQHRMWLVRHLEIIRRLTIDDLKLVKSFCEPCFPPTYDIVRTYVKLYHTAISQHLLQVIEQGLEGNEIVTLLGWINIYYSDEFMGHRGLQIQKGYLGDLLSVDDIESLQSRYLQTLRSNVTEYMSNSMTTDKKDWFSENEPESDGKGFYFTQLPSLLFQIVEQNMQVAQIVGLEVVHKVLDLVLSEISNFANIYRDELRKYKESHLKDRSQPRYYIQYMIANINNCDKLGELTQQLKTKYTEETAPADRLYGSRDRDRYTTINSQYIQVAEHGCIYLKEEVFLDLGEFINNLLTRKWLDTETDVDTICVTVEDYQHDFIHLCVTKFHRLMQMIYEQIIVSYLRQLLSPSRKISFNTNNPDEQRQAAEKIMSESEQIAKTFEQLVPGMAVPREYQSVLPDLAEILKMGDTALMPLELSKILKDYPDAKSDQLISLLQLRADTSRSEAQQLVTDTMADRGAVSVKKSILSRV